MIFGRDYATWEEEIEGLKPQQIQMYALAWQYAETGKCPGCYELIELWERDISPFIRLMDVRIILDRLYWHGYFHRNGYYSDAGYAVDINDYVPNAVRGKAGKNMKYVVQEIGHGREFRVAYNLDAIREVRHGYAKDICGSASTAIMEGYDPMHMVLRIYFKDGDQATFDYDMIDVYTEDDAK